MSRAKDAAKIILYIIRAAASLVLVVLKLVLPLIPRLFRNLITIFNKRLRFSITLKTTATYTLLFTTILLILGILLTGAFASFLIYNTGQTLEKNSQVVAALIVQNNAIPGDQIKNLTDIQVFSASIFDERGKIIYTTVEDAPNRDSASRTYLYDAVSIDQTLTNLYYETPVNLNSGIGKILAVKDLSKEKTYLQGLMISLGAAFLLAVIFVIMVGSRTSRRMLRPINTMTRTARSISIGDLNTRLDVVHSHDELRELAETFNEMLDRIQVSFEKQDIFVSDASHELRTPISVIQGYANLLQRWGKEDPAVLQESIDAIKSESEYMKELVEKLLFLASADKKKQVLETEPFVLNELVEEVLKETALIDAEHKILGEIKGAVKVSGDRALIKQALRIFVDNSIKYTPPGGTITINSELKGDNAVITITDSGVGISREDLPHIFDRFYKVDKSRTREGGGAGLGLSIARWIIDQHQGEIRVESSKGKGTNIIIFLPALKP